MRHGLSVAGLVVLASLGSWSSASAEVERNPFVDGHPLQLLQDPDVVKVLALEATQQEQLQKLAASKKVEQLAEKSLGILSKEQRSRLLPYYYAKQGAYMLFDDSVAETLKLTQDQRKQLQSVAEANRKENQKMRDFMARARFRSKEAMEQYKEGYAKPAEARLLAVLSPRQKQQFDELLAVKK